MNLFNCKQTAEKENRIAVRTYREQYAPELMKKIHNMLGSLPAEIHTDSAVYDAVFAGLRGNAKQIKNENALTHLELTPAATLNAIDGPNNTVIPYKMKAVKSFRDYSHTEFDAFKQFRAQLILGGKITPAFLFGGAGTRSDFICEKRPKFELTLDKLVTKLITGNEADVKKYQRRLEIVVYQQLFTYEVSIKLLPQETDIAALKAQLKEAGISTVVLDGNTLKIKHEKDKDKLLALPALAQQYTQIQDKYNELIHLQQTVFTKARQHVQHIIDSYNALDTFLSKATAAQVGKKELYATALKEATLGMLKFLRYRFELEVILGAEYVQRVERQFETDGNVVMSHDDQNAFIADGLKRQMVHLSINETIQGQIEQFLTKNDFFGLDPKNIIFTVTPNNVGLTPVRRKDSHTGEYKDKLDVLTPSRIAKQLRRLFNRQRQAGVARITDDVLKRVTERVYKEISIPNQGHGYIMLQANTPGASYVLQKDAPAGKYERQTLRGHTAQNEQGSSQGDRRRKREVSAFTYMQERHKDIMKDIPSEEIMAGSPVWFNQNIDDLETLRTFFDPARLYQLKTVEQDGAIIEVGENLGGNKGGALQGQIYHDQNNQSKHYHRLVLIESNMMNDAMVSSIFGDRPEVVPYNRMMYMAAMSRLQEGYQRGLAQEGRSCPMNVVLAHKTKKVYVTREDQGLTPEIIDKTAFPNEIDFNNFEIYFEDFFTPHAAGTGYQFKGGKILLLEHMNKLKKDGFLDEKQTAYLTNFFTRVLQDEVTIDYDLIQGETVMGDFTQLPGMDVKVIYEPGLAVPNFKRNHEVQGVIDTLTRVVAYDSNRQSHSPATKVGKRPFHFLDFIAKAVLGNQPE